MLKAEDTVIKGRVKQELIINWSNSITGHLLGWQPTLEPDAQEKVDAWIREIRLEQAEISFKAGIRELVEWMKQNHHYPQTKGGYYIETGMLEAKLKEWGIE